MMQVNMGASGYSIFESRLEAMGCKDALVHIARRYGVALEQVYEQRDAQKGTESINQARRLCFQYLVSHLGKSVSEVADIFDRSHVTVYRSLQALQTVQSANGAQEPISPTALRLNGTTNGAAHVHHTVSIAALEVQLPLLVSMARELDKAAEETKSDYLRGRAEGIRSAIRLLFPLHHDPD